MYPEDFKENSVLAEIYGRMAPEDKELLEAIHSGKSDEELSSLVRKQTQEKTQK